MSSINKAIDNQAFFKFSYGLFVLTAKDGEKDNGCIINTASQLTDNPKRITIAVNKANFTHNMIIKTGEFNISILTENTPFDIFKQFGFVSGKTTNKFKETESILRTSNKLRYIPQFSNAVISAKVTETFDCDTHTLFIANVTESFVLNNAPSVTYSYYFENIKPKTPDNIAKKKGFICKICGYVHEADELPTDFICPLCKHGADDFEPIL